MSELSTPGAPAPAREMDEGDRQLLEAGATGIRSYLAATPDGIEQVGRVLAPRLSAPMTSETWITVFGSLVALLGEDAATVIAWASTADPSPLDDITAHVEPEVSQFVRVVTATFGAELRDAYELNREMPHNWRYFNREVYYDLIKDQAYIKVSIEKFNNEEVVFEGPPDSMLGFARNLLVTLRFVGSRDRFSESAIASFVEVADEILGILRPGDGNGGSVATGVGAASPGTGAVMPAPQPVTESA